MEQLEETKSKYDVQQAASEPLESRLNFLMKSQTERKDSKRQAKPYSEEVLDKWEIIHFAKLNLSYEIEYLQQILSLPEVKGSNAFIQYCTDIKIDQINDKINILPNSNLNETNQMMRSIASYSMNMETQNIKVYIQKMIIQLNQLKQETLQDLSEEQITNNWEQIQKKIFLISCQIERIRLYLDDQIYPRDCAANLVDIEIDNYNPNLKPNNNNNFDLPSSRRGVTFKDFFSSYDLCKKINKKIQKFENKNIKLLNKDSNSLSRQTIGLLSIDLDSSDSRINQITINKDSKDFEELKKQIKNNNVTQKELFFDIVRRFSPSLANINDIKEILTSHVCLQILIKNCSIGSNEIKMQLYEDNDSALSESTLINPCQFFVQGEYGFIFVHIPIKVLLSGNLVLITNVVLSKTSKNVSHAYKLFKTTEKYSQLKLFKGFSILPLTKLFWAGQLKNGKPNSVEEAKFYRPSSKFKIQESYVQIIEKKQLNKYMDKNLSSSIGLSYNFQLSTKMNQIDEDHKGFSIIQPKSADSLENLMKSKEFIEKVMKKQEYRTNDLIIDLRSLQLSDKLIKKSPLIKIEVALRDNYGMVYDTVYTQNCEEDMGFGQIYESQIYIASQDINIHENFQMRIPTKNIDTLKKIYIIFTVQTLITQKDQNGNKITAKNAHLELENLRFQTEIFGILPLFNQGQMSIIKTDDTYTLSMRLMDQVKLAKFKKMRQINDFVLCEDKLQIHIVVISNEFTHNKFINKLMLINEQNSVSSQLEQTISQLKEIDSDELITFHDKILDKLFQILTLAKKSSTQDLIFETVIQIIELFYNKYKDYQNLLQSYIQNHYAPQKAYVLLLHQLTQTSQIVKLGFNVDNDFKNEDCLLATMKYLSIILQLIKNSYMEEQQCQAQMEMLSESNNESSKLKNFREITSIEGIDNGIPHAHTVQNVSLEAISQSMLKYETYMKIKHSMIEEEDEEEDFFVRNNVSNNTQTKQDNQSQANQSQANLPQQQQKINENYFEKVENNSSNQNSGLSGQLYDPVMKKSLMRKKQIRKSLKNEGFFNNMKYTQIGFKGILQKAILTIFEGCHKDNMKSTISLRSILYENIVDILVQIVDFMDERYFSQLMSFFYFDQINSNNTPSDGGNIAPQNHQSSRAKLFSVSQEISLTLLCRKNSTTSSLINSRMGNRHSELIEDYVTNRNFLEGLKDLHHINEEYIVKMKIMAMAQILSSGILDKIKGNTNRIVENFCKCIEQNYLRRPELMTQIFFFLHQLFQYISNEKEDKHQESELGITNNYFIGKKISLQPQNMNGSQTTKNKQKVNLGSFFAKILPEISTYMIVFYKESNASSRLKESVILEKALSPFLEKTALVCLSVMNSVSKQDLKYIVDEGVRQLLWVMIANTKELYNNKTTRSKTMAKDQLHLSKSKMLDLYKEFYHKYQHIGKTWIFLSKMKFIITQMSGLIKVSSTKTLNLFMDLLCNTAVLEYLSTQNIKHTSSCLFQVFNEIHQSKDYDEVSHKFNKVFEDTIVCTEVYKNNQQFNKIINTVLLQMQQLRAAMQNVWDSNNNKASNILFRTYCQAKLMDLFWELKLFKLFSGHRENFKALQNQMGDYSEMAFTDLRFLEIIQQSEESQIYIGQREITALIQIDLMKGIVENLIKAELYEKAISVLNQIKDLYELYLFDYDAVSKVLVSLFVYISFFKQQEQSKMYKLMSDKQNRHYAQYFKVGFYGQSFPVILKNQEFIYKSTKLAKRLDIFNEIKSNYLDVTIINDSSKPKQDILEGSQKFIQITTVAPLTFRELKDFGLSEKSKDKEELDIGEKVKYLPENLKVYYIENFKNRFYQETVIQGEVGDELENDIQIEIFKVKNKFPSLFKMQHIYKTPKKIQLNAIDRAIRTVISLNEKIQQQIQNVTNQIYEQGNLKQLGGFIQGTLDSKIQGGIQRFMNVFVTGEYLQSNQKPKVLELVKKIQEHSEIVNDALQLHQQNCDDDRLVTKFQGDFSKFKETLDEVKAYVDTSLNSLQNSLVFAEILEPNTMAS